MTHECLPWDVMVRAADQELAEDEAELVKTHLAACETCRESLESLGGLSAGVESAMNEIFIERFPADRQALAARLAEREPEKAAKHAPEKVMRRFGWGMAIAATLAMGIMFAPKQKGAPEQSAASSRSAVTTNVIEVDGETFIALPYSNPDLPASGPRIVQMQVPVSSLADIGISYEPVANQLSAQDRSVLADVLLGADGQPMGVHVVSWE